MKKLCGVRIGEGKARRVFAHKDDDTLVIKWTKRGRNPSNKREWRNWQAAVGTPWEEHFAPCVEISGCGRWLVQVRAEPVGDFHAEKVPAVCKDDRKPENFGLIDGRLVCVDYTKHKPAHLTKEVRWVKSRWPKKG